MRKLFICGIMLFSISGFAQELIPTSIQTYKAKIDKQEILDKLDEMKQMFVDKYGSDDIGVIADEQVGSDISVREERGQLNSAYTNSLGVYSSRVDQATISFGYMKEFLEGENSNAVILTSLPGYFDHDPMGEAKCTLSAWNGKKEIGFFINSNELKSAASFDVLKECVSKKIDEYIAKNGEDFIVVVMKGDESVVFGETEVSRDTATVETYLIKKTDLIPFGDGYSEGKKTKNK